ncbi:MAG: UDP-3-O-acyl-N-acetylglucosamine deacetylase [Pseudomonadota bacterium]
MQTTLANKITFNGVGLHGGKTALMELYPTVAGNGITFERLDLSHQNVTKALYDNVTDTKLCTKLGRGAEAVGTIEHIMAALAGCGVHNVHIRLFGPEVPIMDGSSVEFIKRITETGIVTLDADLQAVRIKQSIRVEEGAAFAELRPADVMSISFSIDFDVPVIGQQSKSLCMANGAFIRELCDSRTFCKKAEVDWLQQNGLGLGGSLDNAIVVDENTVLNPGGFRYADECVRHKMLDALGDLYLAGAPIIGHYVGHRAGHRMTNNVLRKLFAHPDHFEWVTVTPAMAALLPGSDLKESDLALIA